mmetsp:Transcript_23323/g.69851  ORF Transcript_23323/g.69851 Transcript_23323/m.69851 type:complete len:295 (-) Transcript_23323:568-1452(-)
MARTDSRQLGALLSIWSWNAMAKCDLPSTGSSTPTPSTARAATRAKKRMLWPLRWPSTRNLARAESFEPFSQTSHQLRACASTYASTPSSGASSGLMGQRHRSPAARSCAASSLNVCKRNSSMSRMTGRQKPTWWFCRRERTRFSKSSSTPWSQVTPTTTTQPRRLCMASSSVYRSVCRGCRAKPSSSSSTTSSGARRSARRRRSSSTNNVKSSTYLVRAWPVDDSWAASSRRPVAGSAWMMPERFVTSNLGTPSSASRRSSTRIKVAWRPVPSLPTSTSDVDSPSTAARRRRV